jgi:hypothetical protein
MCCGKTRNAISKLKREINQHIVEEPDYETACVCIGVKKC